MNIIARLEYELAYYDSSVHRFNHYTTTRGPPAEILEDSRVCHIPPRLLLESFCQINERYTQPLVLLLVLFLELPENRHHVCCAPDGSEVTLALLNMFFRDSGSIYFVQQNPCEDFSCDEQQNNPLVIGAVRFVPFVMITALWRFCGSLSSNRQRARRILYATLGLQVSKFQMQFY